MGVLDWGGKRFNNLEEMEAFADANHSLPGMDVKIRDINTHRRETAYNHSAQKHYERTGEILSTDDYDSRVRSNLEKVEAGRKRHSNAKERFRARSEAKMENGSPFYGRASGVGVPATNPQSIVSNTVESAAGSTTEAATNPQAGGGFWNRLFKSGNFHSEEEMKNIASQVNPTTAQIDGGVVPRKVSNVVGEEFLARSRFIKGAGYGAMAAAAGIGLYGLAKMTAPANVDIEDPGSRLVKGALVGGVTYGAIDMARQSENLTKMLGAKSPKLLESIANIAKPMTQGWRGSAIGGAVMAAMAVGSGSFRANRTVNPIDSV